MTLHGYCYGCSKICGHTQPHPLIFQKRKDQRLHEILTVINHKSWKRSKETNKLDNSLTLQELQVHTAYTTNF